MITLLQYLVIAAVIAAIVFGITLLVFGRGEQLAPLPPRTSPAQLPGAGEVTGQDVKSLRLSVALRGYRMSDVDWTLDRLGEELDQLRTEQTRLQELVTDLGGDPLPPVPAPPAQEQPASDPSGGETQSAGEAQSAGEVQSVEREALVRGPAEPAG